MSRLNVTARADGRFAATVNHAGKRRYVYGRTEAEARRKANDLLASLGKAGALPNAGRRTVADLLDVWLASADLRPKTRHGYGQLLARVRPVLGGCRLDKLEPSTLSALYAELAATSKRTAARTHAVLHRAFRLAVLWGWLATNPADRVLRPAYRPERRDVWDAAQVRAFLAGTAEHWLGPLWAVAIGTGCRLSELAGLRWDDVDLSAGTLTVRRTVQRIGGQWVEGEPKTSAGRRGITLPPFAVAALHRQRALVAERRLRYGTQWLDDGGAVFPGGRGGPLRPDTAQHAMAHEVERLGLPKLTPHGLRHLHASLLLDAGEPLPAVSARLGHANANITAGIYAHRVGDADRRAADALGQAIG